MVPKVMKDSNLMEKEILLGHVESIDIPDRAVVGEDKKSGAKYTAFAFVFPDGIPATIILTKGIKTGWIPSKDIKRILIEFTQ